jgi:hypothetical protein
MSHQHPATVKFWEIFMYSIYYSFVGCAVCFLPLCSLAFHSLHTGFFIAKNFNFDEVHLINFPFYGSSSFHCQVKEFFA